MKMLMKMVGQFGENAKNMVDENAKKMSVLKMQKKCSEHFLEALSIYIYIYIYMAVSILYLL